MASLIIFKHRLIHTKSLYACVSFIAFIILNDYLFSSQGLTIYDTQNVLYFLNIKRISIGKLKLKRKTCYKSYLNYQITKHKCRVYRLSNPYHNESSENIALKCLPCGLVV